MTMIWPAEQTPLLLPGSSIISLAAEVPAQPYRQFYMHHVLHSFSMIPSGQPSAAPARINRSFIEILKQFLNSLLFRRLSQTTVYQFRTCPPSHIRPHARTGSDWPATTFLPYGRKTAFLWRTGVASQRGRLFTMSLTVRTSPLRYTRSQDYASPISAFRISLLLPGMPVSTAHRISVISSQIMSHCFMAVIMYRFQPSIPDRGPMAGCHVALVPRFVGQDRVDDDKQSRCGYFRTSGSIHRRNPSFLSRILPSLHGH